jgi:ATP-dependent helicase/nuclease subunit B
MAKANLFTIPSGNDFLQTLVHGLKTQFGDELAKALILLPTRRACQNLREAFLNEAGGEGAMLLPDIRPLGEVEEEELMLSGGADFLRRVASLPRKMEVGERKLLLAQLVERMNVPGVSKAQAFLLAGDLGHLLDDALIEGCDLANLASLVPDRYAAHWQQIIDFLKIVQEHWPKILQTRGAIDAVDYRQRLARLLIEHWEKHPPSTPVVAAGSTGSQPVTAELLKCIAHLPQGAVVLPGLDKHLEEEAWADLTPTHPQYFLSKLLKRMDLGRDEVKLWPGAKECPRAVLLSEVMRPAEAADRWRHLNAGEIGEEGWQGLEVIEAAQEHEEALVAALMLRKAASEEGKTAALITPDRALAKRVCTLMRRWNIELDDSAGTPLSETPIGSYLALLLDLPHADLRPSQLMGFLKHPFTGLGMERVALLEAARKLETDFFRRDPRGRGLKTWHALLRKKESLLEKLIEALLPLQDGKEKPLAVWAEELRTVAGKLAVDEALLRNEREGEALARLAESFSSSSESFSCSFADFAEIFRNGLKECVVRKAWGQHPRLFVLGLLEARLLHFDHVILAGLNENSWPREKTPDPWMSAAMRVELGCHDPESRIGQMAHDFVQAAAAAHVSLLRGRRSGEAPTISSRWLLRLEAVRQLTGWEFPASPWLGYAQALDFCAEMEACDPPAVQVPVAALPKKLNASDVELWVRDPYAFYARRVLELRALGALDAPFSAKERGSLIHKVLEDLTAKYPNSWPMEAQQEFLKLMREGLAAYGATPEETLLFMAHMENLARNYWEWEDKNRADVALQFSEYQGSLAMQVEDYSFQLAAKADRIDALKAGGVAIYDFKTGQVPAAWKAEHGLLPQLYVEAIIAAGGGFHDPGKQETKRLSYVAFDQGKGVVKERVLSLEANELEEKHKPGFENFVRAFIQKEARYLSAPRPQLLPPSPDYARLARVAEWSKGAIEQDEGDA